MRKIMKQIVQINKCPNCYAKLEHAEGSSKLICEYCGAEFDLLEIEKEDTGDTEISSQAPTEQSEAAKEQPKASKEQPKASKEQPEASKEQPKAPEKAKSKKARGWGDQDWFDTRVEYQKLCNGEDTRKLMKTLVKCVTELKTPEKIIKFIRTDITKGGGVGMAGINEEKLNQITARAGKVLDQDETPIIYANTALLSNGKKGMLITDKRTVVVKSSVNSVLHEDLDLIGFDTEEDFANIYLNGSDSTELTTPMSADGDLLGAMIALICAYAFAKDPCRDKIIIQKQEEEDDDSED